MNSATRFARDVFTQQQIEIRICKDRFDRVQICDRVETDLWICPGFIDLQVNGYGGIDLNDDSCTAQDVSHLVSKLASLGTTTFLPTLITAKQSDLLSRIRTIVNARRLFPSAEHAIPCIHLEGPNISPLDGYRGAHPLEAVRAPSLLEFDELQRAAEGLIGLVTLSPHWPGSADYISALTQRGVAVSIGHTDASPDMIRDAVEAGASLSTHLGNGIAAQLPRHPNPIWTQLADDRLTATLIADGVHLSTDVLKAMIRAKGVERTVLVSDSVSLAGSLPGHYQSNIGQAVVVERDGSIRMPENGLLAGSGIALVDAVRFAAAVPGFSLRDAIQMATINPARFLKQRRSHTAVDQPADFILIKWKPGEVDFEIVETFVQGRVHH